MRTKTILLLIAVSAGGLVSGAGAQGGGEAGLSANTCGPFVEGSGMTGDFLLGVSYYGAVGITNANRMRGDLDDFEARGLNNVRVWGNWTHWDAANSTIFNGNGTIIGGALSRLILLTQEAAARNMIVDLTFSWRHFKQNQCAGGDCFGKYKNGLANAAAALTPYRNLFFDLANEHNSGNTSLTLNEIRELENAVHAEDPLRVVTVSAVGSPSIQGGRFSPLLNDGTLDFAAPHFQRTTDWADQTGVRLEALRNAITGSWPIHLQEEARRGANCGSNQDQSCCGGSEANCSLEDFLTALALAAQEGAAGWVLHTDAGFRLDQGTGSFWSRLDSTERAVMNQMAGVLRDFRCLPAPVYSDDFDDAADDVPLQGRPLQVGDAIWDTVEPAWKLETKDQKVTTANPNGTPVGGIPYRLPGDFEGVAAIEAELTLGRATSVSIGFSSSPEEPLAEDGVFWVSLTGSFYVYGPGGVVLEAIHFLVPVTRAVLRLEYDGGVPELRLLSRSEQPGGGWELMATVAVAREAIDFAVLEIDHGHNQESFVDDFAVRLSP
jgi:hypothetical protein